jgi:hypothetical protein
VELSAVTLREKPFVAQPREKTPDRTTELPNPELNPLLNPTLGQNLGRWAHVYFTSPPEKREQAILELLHELQAEAGAGEAAQFDQGTAPDWLRRGEGTQISPEGLHCVECGHQNARQQRFCGMCGSSLTLDDNAATEPLPQTATSGDGAPRATPPAPIAPDPSPGPTFGTLSLFASVEPQPPVQTANGNGSAEVQWLRDKNLYVRAESREGSHSAKYALAVLVVVLVGVFFYAQSRSPNNRPTPATASSGDVGTSQAVPASPTTPRPSPSAQTAATSDVAGQTAKENNAPAPTRQPVQRVRNDSLASAAQSVSTRSEIPPYNPDSGAAELATAEDYLTGKNGGRNSAEAAKFLWRAVGKQNVTAILLLSNLYLTGDGVPKSCDQGRLLLDAAAQRNSSQAADKLRELQRSGCP